MDMATVMATEDIMQSNTVSSRDGEIEIDLLQLALDILDGVRRQGWLYLALASLVGTICFFTARFRYTPYYEAYTTFTVNTVSSINYSSKSVKRYVTNQMGTVFPYILTSSALNNLVKEDMGYSDGVLPASISASAVKDTNLVTLRVRSGDPQIAYDTLRSVLRNYPSISEVAIGDVELKQMDESGIPTAPANVPNSKKAAGMGILLTLSVCIAWLTFKSITRKTIRTEEELTRYFNTEFLGSIPSVVFKKRSKMQELPVAIDTEGIPFAFVEAIRTIRHRVEREAKKASAKTIVVTSALQSEGKTTTAVNLALALANRKHNVLLLDGDLRNPSILQALGLDPSDKGMVDLLSGQCKPEEVLMPYKSRKHLVLMPGGKPIDNPTELWTGGLTKDLLTKLHEKCDYVIIDAPPSAIVSDASLIARLCDGCVYVVRQDYASINTLREGMEMFSGTGCKLLGCVLNHAEAGGGYGYGRYGYGYGRYGHYGYGKYGYGKSGYGYGYGETEEKAVEQK